MATSPYVRKSIYNLSNEERQNLRNAFQSLYEAPLVGNQSLVSEFANRYQELANILITFGHYQRNDLLFLPWARAYFYTFEQALRKIDDSVTLPYWDYTSSQAIKEGIPSLIADPTYMVDGEECPNPLFAALYKTPLRTFRDEAENTDGLIVARLQQDNAMVQTNFMDFGLTIYPVDIMSHVYIGDSSKDTRTAAYDPIFWFTHCQLDYSWSQWQQSNRDQQVPASVLGAQLKPFLLDSASSAEAAFLTGRGVMQTTQLGYVYE